MKPQWMLTAEATTAVVAVKHALDQVVGAQEIGLTANGVLCEVTETSDIVIDDVTGLENIITRLQGEFAYNVGVKGFKYDVGNGAANPNATALGTGSNWDLAASDLKSVAGVVIKSR